MVSLELCLGLRAGRWRGIVVFVGFFGTIWRDVPPGCWLSERSELRGASLFSLGF